MVSDTTAIVAELSSPVVASLLSAHPNDVTLLAEPPSCWAPWWSWAAQASPEHTSAWLQVMHYYTRVDVSGAGHHQIPPELRALVDAVRSFQLDRAPLAYETRNAGDRSYRMSPKKEHEVDRMSSYIRHLVHSESPRSVWHAVDVGSGQGYLSRALQELDFDVLALDNDENQTSGANRWVTKEAARHFRTQRRTNLGCATKPSTEKLAGHSREERGDDELPQPHNSQASGEARKGSLTHRTVQVCPRTLDESIVDWLIGLDNPDVHHPPKRSEPVPIMFVALHACGSLTVDVLRAFLSDRADPPQPEGVVRSWSAHSLVVVGCCYNLMSPSDFPLSKPLRAMSPVPKLTIGACHLAAQVPSQWLKSEDTIRNAERALRKVVYRALLQPVLQSAAAQLDAAGDHATHSERPIRPGLGETPENRRLGKLNDKAYQDWPTFLECATSKMSIELAAINESLPAWFTHEATRLKMESALFVLQTLRCILGPMIETLILLDRRDWIQNQLAEMNDRGPEVEVELVNLFDQATGSGRNVALVIKPATSPQKLVL